MLYIFIVKKKYNLITNKYNIIIKYIFIKHVYSNIINYFR